MVVLVHLNTSYGCFCTTLAELRICNKDPTAHKAYNINSLTLNRKILLTLAYIEGGKSGPRVNP